MNVENGLTNAVRRAAAALGAGLTRWSGEGEQAAGGDAGHLATEDPSLFEPRVYGDPAKLHVASTAVVNDALFNLSSGEITVEEYAFFGHRVSVLTGTHDITVFDRARQITVPKSGRDVVIGRGAWISTNALVLGPCRIGEHAVVAAGSVVLSDVEPFTVVGGTPARELSRITQRPEGGR